MSADRTTPAHAVDSLASALESLEHAAAHLADASMGAPAGAILTRRRAREWARTVNTMRLEVAAMLKRLEASAEGEALERAVNSMREAERAHALAERRMMSDEREEAS